VSVPARNLPDLRPHPRRESRPEHRESKQPPSRSRPRPAPTPDPGRPGVAAQTTAARPNPSTPPQRRARRGSHPAFWIFSGIVVAVLVIGVVAINALVVNTTYKLRGVQQEVHALSDDSEDLQIQVAHRSSPSRIAAWADGHGMILPAPQDVVPLAVPGRRDGGRA
jgi:cell division protein FtsL